MIGKILDGKYEILSQVGEGGMGAVFEAKRVDGSAGSERVAIKMILAEDLTKKKAHVRRFHREARAAGTIDTPHIARVSDSGFDDEDRPFMVMELMTGRDLSAVVKAEGLLAPEVAVAIAEQACRGLAAAHEVGVVHRDIKPGNVFLHEHDGRITVKLCDFGIAKLDANMLQQFQESTLTKTGSLLGSPLYMSPEQARGKKEIDGRADVWSMGVVLYRLVAGRAPFQEVEALGDLIITICGTPVPPVQDFAPWVPAPVAAVLHRALRLRPEERYQSAAEMADALRDALDGKLPLLTPAVVTALDDGLRGQVRSRASLEAEEPPAMSKTETGLSHTAHPEPNGPSRPMMVVSLGAALLLGAVGLYGWLGGTEQGSGNGANSASRPATTTVAPHDLKQPSSASAASASASAASASAASASAASASAAPSSERAAPPPPSSSARPTSSTTVAPPPSGD